VGSVSKRGKLAVPAGGVNDGCEPGFSKWGALVATQHAPRAAPGAARVDVPHATSAPRTASVSAVIAAGTPSGFWP
jgi:hypothetical protein